MFCRRASQQFLERGLAGLQPAPAVLAQEAQLPLAAVGRASRRAQRRLVAAMVDQLAQAVVDFQQFVDAEAAEIAGAGAVAAADRLPQLPDGWRQVVIRRRRAGRLAVRAKAAHQALGEDTEQAGREQEGLDAHVGQPGGRADRVVGVQRGQHQMAGQAGLDGDLRRLGIADLADHDDVRVLPQDGAQGLGEAEVDAGIDLDLADAGEVVFDRVLDRHDVLPAGVEAR